MGEWKIGEVIGDGTQGPAQVGYSRTKESEGPEWAQAPPGMMVADYGTRPVKTPHQVACQAKETTGLWDFLMKTAFLGGKPTPPKWMKVKLDEWFKGRTR